MKLVVTFLVMNLYLSAHAVSERGNGGYSVVCRDNKGPITSAELLDVYEGRLIFKRTYSENGATVEELVKNAHDRLKDFPEFHNKLAKELELISRNIVFIPEGNELEQTQDHLPTIKKKGCEFEQLGNYTDDGELIVSQEIHDKLDNLNKAAFLLHEAIYAIRRKSLGDKFSPGTRRIVAHLMASNFDQATLGKLIAESLYPAGVRKRSCGLKGDLLERIDHCSYVERAKTHYFLVTRTEDMKEVWYDSKKKLLWGDRFQDFMNYYEAQKVCDEVSSEMGYMPEFRWRLPTASEFESLGQYADYLLPNLTNNNSSYMFWTSSTKGNNPLTYNATEGGVGSTFFKKSPGSVRCVAENR